LAVGPRSQSGCTAREVGCFYADDKQAGTALLGSGEREVDGLRESSRLHLVVEDQHHRAVATRLRADEDDGTGGLGCELAHAGRRRRGTPPDDEQFRDVRHVHENRGHRPGDGRAVRGQPRTPRASQLDPRGRHMLRRCAPRIVRAHQPRPVAVGACQGAIDVHHVERVTGASGLIGRPGENRSVLIRRADADDNRSVHDCLLRR
jgi:hypothetical protein